MFPFPFDFSEKTRVKFKLHARHPTFLRTVNDRPCETSCETSFIFRRNDLRREIFCVLFSENNLVVICFSGNFFLFCVSFVPNARTKQQKKEMFHAYAQGLSRYFCNRMRFWWPLHPFVVLFFSSHSCSVCANEGHCLLLGTMARLQTVATLATRPASARVNRRVWMNGACLVRFLFFPRCLRIFGLVQDPRPMFANCRRPWWRPMILRRIRPLLATMTLFFPPIHSSFNGNVLSNDFQWKRNVQRHLLPTARTCTFCVWIFLSICRRFNKFNN